MISDQHILQSTEGQMTPTATNRAAIKQNKITVLLADDDASIRRALERSLTLEGFSVLLAEDGLEALKLSDQHSPDILVLDIEMPNLNGIKVIEQLRANGSELPILVLSAQVEVDDRVRGLAAGADDYLVKPFALGELVARIDALLRRTKSTEQENITVADLTISPATRSVTRGDQELELTRREFDLLVYLASNSGIVISRDQLLSEVWGYDFPVEGNVVDVFIGYLRKKLEINGKDRLIHTIRGVGFMLKP